MVDICFLSVIVIVLLTKHNNASYKSWGFGSMQTNCYLQTFVTMDTETRRKPARFLSKNRCAKFPYCQKKLSFLANERRNKSLK